MVGEDFAVNVVISDVADLHTWEFKLFYETKYINAIRATEGSFLKSFANGYSTYFTMQINDAYNSTHGLVWTSCALPFTSASGNGTLATIDFGGADAGTSHMVLEDPVKLKDSNLQTISSTITNGEVLVVWPEPLDINIDMGTIYFSGEVVESFILTTFRGGAVTPTSMSTMLYNPEGEAVQLVPEQIATGFYKATYTMPSEASPGTYAIKVKATYVTDTIQALGTSFKTWQLSSTLNSKLVYIEGTVAWIKTNLGLLKTDVSNLNLQVLEVKGNTVTIQTTLGTLQGTITSINNNIATVRTDVGTMKVDLSTVTTNTTPRAVDWNAIGLYVSLALLASIVVALAVLYFYMRARFRSGIVPS
jgi:flagellin-like hook-associated protein FlgL